jgi:serine/threonine protein phosphatase PrpC
MSLSFSSATHTGVRRQNNEDSCCVRPELGLFVVADGVGGYAAGEVASHAAVEAIQQAVADTVGRTEQSVWPFDYQPALGVDGNRLNWAFHLANTRIRTETESGRGRPGMATTVAAVLFEADAAGVHEPVRGATIGHIGDSRIYRYRRGSLDRLTRDHSWVEEQVQAGFISDHDARVHPRRNLLTRALTGGTDPVADLAWVPASPGDRLLLCSDGLYSVLTDEQIAEILARYEREPDQANAADDRAATAAPEAADTERTVTTAVADSTMSDATVTDVIATDATVPGAAANGAEASPDAVCDALVHAANLAGGPDNVTVILIRL